MLRGYKRSLSLVRDSYLAPLLAAILLLVPRAARAQTAPDAADVLREGGWSKGVASRTVGTLPVLPDFEQLAVLGPGSLLRLRVAPGAFIAGSVDRIERRSPTNYSIFGRPRDDPMGFLIIVVQDDAAVGMIHQPMLGQDFRLGYVANGVHEIEPIDPTRFGACGTQSKQAGGVPPPESVGTLSPDVTPEVDVDESGVPRGSCAAPRRHFDMVVYYTTAARVEAGGTSAMQAECQLAVDTSNQTYINSGIPARQVLVFRGETSYNETTSVETDRNRLQDPDDGYLDGAQSTRDTYGGDFVVLLVDGSDPDFCGYAFCTPEDSSWGYCVVQRGCASGNFSFPHEVGHLQGCAHNRADAGSGCNFYCDSFGHRFNGDTGVWRTVMSYDTDPSMFTRIGWFSNPLVNFDGVPTGADGDCDTKTNNAGTIFGTTAGRELWRAPRFETWVSLNAAFPWYATWQNPMPSVATGVATVYGGAAAPLIEPTLWIKSGTYAENMTISKRMTVKPCGGSVRIGN